MESLKNNIKIKGTEKICCSENPAQASRDFQAVRTNVTGKSKILSYHFIQSFAPGEITPDRYLGIGIELCDKFLKGEYQYFLAVHMNKEHIHLHCHCIFNNCNMYDYKTFETHEDQGKKNERAWKKLFDFSDEICKRHMLSVIQHPETSKGNLDERDISVMDTEPEQTEEHRERKSASRER